MKTKRASALLFSTILLFIVLSMVISMSYVTVMEQKMSQKTKSSVGSFFNADSGVEWALNKIANSTNSTIAGTFGGFNSDHSVSSVPTGANYEIYLLGEDGKVITTDADISTVKAVRAVGTQTAGDTTQRAIEAAVAAGATGKYQGFGMGEAGKECILDTEMGRLVCYQWAPGGWQTWPTGNPINNPGGDALQVP